MALPLAAAGIFLSMLVAFVLGTVIGMVKVFTANGPDQPFYKGM